jgi:aldehyde:ferredoxin oxidoreductase
VDWLNAVTGWGLSAAQALSAGEAIFQAKVQFNRREGYSPDNATLPERVLAGPIGRHLPAMREEYRQLRRWT